MRVHSAYESLGLAAPKDLLDTPAVESIVELFECLGRLTEEGIVVRITGSNGTLHILGIALFLFPLDTIVTVESLIIHEGSGRRVIIELCADKQTQVQLEKELNPQPLFTLPIKSHGGEDKITDNCSFVWEGWLARKLQLEFAKVGVTCTTQVLMACSTILIYLAPKYTGNPLYRTDTSLPHRGIEGLLGQYPRDRMEHVCRSVLLEPPEQTEADFKSQWEKFVLILERALERVACSCSSCNLSTGWPETDGRKNKQQLACPLYRLWGTIGQVLTAGACCFLINVRGSVAVPGRLPPNVAGEIISRAFIGKRAYISTRDLHTQTFSMFAEYSSETSKLGRSSGACTIFPTVLETFVVHSDGLFTFELRDGVFIFETRYYDRLSTDGESRPRARKSLLSGPFEVIPSSIGEHSTMTVTIREAYDRLVLQATVHALGSYIRIDMASIIYGYMGLQRTQECEHRLDVPLSEKYKKGVIITGVNMPRGVGSRLSIAMTRQNREAQLLCCEGGVKCLLLQECCLDCGVEQAQADDFHVLIV
ncbi:hypothetical protein B0T10DRAFT_551311 [Thelonectria olida]|uniref:Uncharacterized protein n=1 Tax=Thelonectria olida TaxID=1576542 RepID=A0A9P8VWM3_9HYPO|nr:hypothetical protein B0T10DRAFT_551311 [Thelonectria olida]